jgi:hypothetical protein
VEEAKDEDGAEEDVLELSRGEVEEAEEGFVSPIEDDRELGCYS